MDSYDEQPWKNAKDKSEYFNYNFNEETWKIYQQSIAARKEEALAMESDPERIKIFNNSNLYHFGVINFYLGHDFGGANEPLNKEQYGHIPLYKENQEIPILKPKTTLNNKNEFHINFPINPEAQTLTQEEMRKIIKPVVRQWEQTTKLEKEQELQIKQQELSDLRKELELMQRENYQKQREEKKDKSYKRSDHHSDKYRRERSRSSERRRDKYHTDKRRKSRSKHSEYSRDDDSHKRHHKRKRSSIDKSSSRHKHRD